MEQRSSAGVVVIVIWTGPFRPSFCRAERATKQHASDCYCYCLPARHHTDALPPPNTPTSDRRQLHAAARLHSAHDKGPRCPASHTATARLDQPHRPENPNTNHLIDLTPERQAAPPLYTVLIEIPAPSTCTSQSRPPAKWDRRSRSPLWIRYVPSPPPPPPPRPADDAYVGRIAVRPLR